MPLLMISVPWDFNEISLTATCTLCIVTFFKRLRFPLAGTLLTFEIVLLLRTDGVFPCGTLAGTGALSGRYHSLSLTFEMSCSPGFSSASLLSPGLLFALT